MFPRLCQDIIFKTGSGDKLREIDIGAAYEALDPRHSSAILSFHAFTGCDQTGKFYGKTKAFCWKILLESSDEELAALQQLGESEEFSTEDMIPGLESFTIRLYRQNVAQYFWCKRSYLHQASFMYCLQILMCRL